MLNQLLSGLQNRSATKKGEIFFPFFQNTNDTVLDFGCGDLSLAKAIYKRNKKLKITGVDVVDFKEKIKYISFQRYNGEKIPFNNNTFDTVISVFVFHHCKSAEASFRECLRVAKKRVIIVEAVARSSAEIPLMKFVDWLSNTWKREDVPLTYQFHTVKEWRKIFKKANAGLGSANTQENIISVLPIGKTYIFEVIKK